MSTQVSSLGRTSSVVFWKALFFCDGIIGLWYSFCLDNWPVSCAKFLVYRCGPPHLLRSLLPASNDICSPEDGLRLFGRRKRFFLEEMR